ncbi:hypothetical protein F441_01941, partial [Phytophthora nicotianae CJ01A1]
MEDTTSARPVYTPFRHTHASHGGFSVFAGAATTIDCSPLAIFQRFVSPEMLCSLVMNTNAYAVTKNARKWKILTFNELQTWIGIIIFMGIYRIARPRPQSATALPCITIRWLHFRSSLLEFSVFVKNRVDTQINMNICIGKI